MIGSPRQKNKALTLYILKILQDKTSEKNPMTVAQIRKELLKEPYDFKKMPHRDTIKAHLEELRAFYNDEYIYCKETSKNDKSIYSHAWYYKHSLSDKDIKSIMHSILYSPTIAEKEKGELANRVKNVLSPEALIKFDYISSSDKIPTRTHEPRKENIDILNRLIDITLKNRVKPLLQETVIRFHFNKYDIQNKKLILVPIREEKYELVPLQIVGVDHIYYLIGYHDNGNHLYHYRIDLMSDMDSYERGFYSNKTKTALIKKVSSKKQLKRYIQEHPFMYYESGDDNVVQEVTIKLDDSTGRGLTNFVDVFGENFEVVKSVKKENEKYYIVKVNCVKSASVNFVNNNEVAEIIKVKKLND